MTIENEIAAFVAVIGKERAASAIELTKATTMEEELQALRAVAKGAGLDPEKVTADARKKANQPQRHFNLSALRGSSGSPSNPQKANSCGKCGAALSGTACKVCGPSASAAVTLAQPALRIISATPKGSTTPISTPAAIVNPSIAPTPKPAPVAAATPAAEPQTHHKFLSVSDYHSLTQHKRIEFERSGGVVTNDPSDPLDYFGRPNPHWNASLKVPVANPTGAPTAALSKVERMTNPERTEFFQAGGIVTNELGGNLRGVDIGRASFMKNAALSPAPVSAAEKLNARKAAALADAPVAPEPVAVPVVASSDEPQKVTLDAFQKTTEQKQNAFLLSKGQVTNNVGKPPDGTESYQVSLARRRAEKSAR